MATISDVSIINSNTAEAKPVEAGFERTICGESLCGSKTLTVYRRTVLEGRRFTTHARDDYHLVYVMETSKKGLINFNNETHPTEEGAGVLLAPGELARFEASRSDLELLHMVVPKPPAAVEDGLPGGPGYFLIGRRSARSVTLAAAACVVSAPNPMSGYSMAAGSRRPMPFRRARCTITRGARPPIMRT